MLSGGGVGGEALVDLLALGVAGEAGGREVGAAAAQDDHLTERGRLLGEPVPAHPFGVVGPAVRSGFVYRGDAGHRCGENWGCDVGGCRE